MKAGRQNDMVKETVEGFKLKLEQLGSELVALVGASRGSKRYECRYT